MNKNDVAVVGAVGAGVVAVAVGAVAVVGAVVIIEFILGM